MVLMKNSKKAVFFTLISLIFIGIFVTTYRVKVEYGESDKMHSIKARINLMDDFVRSLENDAPRAQYIAGFRGVYSLSNYVCSHGDPVNVDLAYDEVFTNGTIEGNESYALLMKNQSIKSWTKRMSLLAESMNLILNISVSNVSVVHATPFSLKATMDISYNLTDRLDTASWNRSRTIVSYISIEGWQDPLFSLRTNGGSRVIHETNLSSFNTVNVLSMFTNKSYFEVSNGPSFLDRLENRTVPTSSGFGIGTLLNPNYYGNPQNASVLDYAYWNTTIINASKVTGISDSGYSDFRIQDDLCTEWSVTCY